PAQRDDAAPEPGGGVPLHRPLDRRRTAARPGRRPAPAPGAAGGNPRRPRLRQAARGTAAPGPRTHGGVAVLPRLLGQVTAGAAAGRRADGAGASGGPGPVPDRVEPAAARLEGD